MTSDIQVAVGTQSGTAHEIVQGAFSIRLRSFSVLPTELNLFLPIPTLPVLPFPMRALRLRAAAVQPNHVPHTTSVPNAVPDRNNYPLPATFSDTHSNSASHMDPYSDPDTDAELAEVDSEAEEILRDITRFGEEGQHSQSILLKLRSHGRWKATFGRCKTATPFPLVSSL